ncbi:putative HTH-type transcriptional regulator YdfH [Planococcus massiliensis]|uniref:Putative HTH-type transcriptional regulator YdfH n=1 Tax=Planococcus massiliensis TaxID=1499687 RepID=A0A098EGU0_9BACL|nr:GntR family transcriptional regulator [Planococcus massiliensis]CEG21483.1 putative HTH-type transcriptional regulator YdfH [Planococcus massiliensis]
MNNFTIEKPIPYYEQFYHSIKEMIFEGKYKPGDRIIENQLAKEFNVSKSPIREAIRMLEHEGLIVTDEKSKMIVYEPTLKDVEEIYFCRKALESFAVRLMIQKAIDEEILKIEDLLKETESAIQQSKDSNTIISMNASFHNLIIEYTKNDRLKKQLTDLKSIMYFFRIINFQGENRATDILNQHKNIFSHIKNRDEEKAAEAMLEHLQMDLDHLIKVLTTK